jgi:hypothetical protein
LVFALLGCRGDINSTELKKYLRVQAHSNNFGGSPDRSLPESYLQGAVEEESAGRIRFQETDGLFGMGDIARDRMRSCLFDRQAPLSVFDVMADRVAGRRDR